MKGLTQEEFAKKIGVSKPKVSMIETGNIRRISETLLKKISEVLNCNSDELLEKAEINTLKDCIKSYLDRLGIPEQLMGYQYITDMILLLEEERGLFKKNLKQYYGIIIDQNSYSVKTSAITCSVRYAIHRGFIDTRNISLWDELFGKNIEPNSSKFFEISCMMVHMNFAEMKKS